LADSLAAQHGRRNLSIEYNSTEARSPFIGELVELWHYRDLLMLLVTNSIKTRYKRSTLGVLWTLLNPLLNTLVLTIAFQQIMRFDVENYTIYLLVGLLFWTFFSQTTTQAMNTLIWGSNLLKRIYVPRTIFAVSVLGNGLINFLLSLIPLAAIMLFTRHPFHPTLLLLPFAILLMAMFTLGLSLFISALAVFFVDVVDIYSILLQALFYLTPIIYPLSMIPDQIARFIKLNPMTTMVDLFRSLIYSGQIPPVSLTLTAVGLSVFSLILGWWVFTKRVDEFAYRL
jgi:ABC-type polysaccharide/polyol phosphate export permease